MADRANVSLVGPPARLFGQNSRDAFAVQIGPLVVCAIDADGQVCEAV